MLRQVLPRIVCEATTLSYGRFAIGPMERGYGMTVGTALRRVLLSSLPGAAITSVRVAGVPHEFSPIPGAKEDVMRFILNLKRVRLISHSEDTVHMRVSAQGKSVITAGDIEVPADIEIINPELQLLTLDTLDSELDFEMTVDQGVGYSPAEERGTLPIGQIPIDAIFSPIVKVHTDVTAARIEQRTDYDLLKLEVWTDGTMQPTEALRRAAKMLLAHFEPVAVFEKGVSEEDVVVPVEEESEFADIAIEELELPMRAFNCLKRAGIMTVGEILDRLEKGASEMLAIRNFGQKSLVELVDTLKERGYLASDYELDL